KPLASRLHTLRPECGQKHRSRAPSSWARAGLVTGGLLSRRMGMALRRATRTIGCERGWLRPNFIAVCLDETEDRAQRPPESGGPLRWLPSRCLVSLLGSRREDRVPTRRGKRIAATPH